MLVDIVTCARHMTDVTKIPELKSEDCQRVGSTVMTRRKRIPSVTVNRIETGSLAKEEVEEAVEFVDMMTNFCPQQSHNMNERLSSQTR